MDQLRIIFMGTPEFAVASLDRLLQNGSNIVAVITAPDKPSGRGLQVNESAVKRYAVSKGLKILQPEKLKAPEFLEDIQLLNADLQIVVAFRMLPEVVWNMPPSGTINLHASLLPQYRGAAPINWAIINGERETGLTTFKLRQEIDTGDILLQQRMNINEDETAGELHDRMKEAGANLLLRTVSGITKNNLQQIPQTQLSTINYQLSTIQKLAPKIFTDTCKVDWNKGVDDVYNLIRGLSPYPCAFTVFNEKILKLYSTKKDISVPLINAGEIETDKKTYLKFACANGFINILELQLEGKKRMGIEEFLKGYRF